ncbi:hypothetical protein PTTG_26649 [Puccinia triticina 1-1 BBBD Race 1]|uniref:L domain-like protein n=2 Tax=Puccinia triticina TaxID=208348 RepID=A0A180GRU4_PUCT1|nr:uncharacterized protein PtA15_10A182 [Puccinia triticina]OAV95547.1 hypothetical protein PTTG_26649 [Puccinia triticina 1-1 BBBD Race 1]WAQ88763.1 hypothetical protein PtA15_10A182 [Puccinia triticina]
MAPSTHSSPTTDPFAAIYKARPGELPSSLSIDSYHIKRAEHAKATDPSADLSPPSTPTQKSAQLDLKQRQNVFSPSLAGERDRGVRKRMLSNPESLLLASPSIASSSAPSMPSTSKSMAVEVDDTMIRDTQEEEGDPEENNGRFRGEPTQSDPFAAPFSTPPRRGGIFFSPPRSLDTLTAKRTRSEDLTRTIHRVRPKDETETMLSADSHLRFSSAFSRAVIRGDMCLDLDNQELHTIPDLTKLLEEQKAVVGRMQDKAKVTAMIEKLVNPGGMSGGGGARQPITRAKSAPLVSFSPHATASLFLSNNQLTSSAFAQLGRICYFQGLQNLSLRSNQLTELPSEIGNLRSLRVLNLAYNRLEFLPASILQLVDCKLFLNGNPWLKPPSSSVPPLVAASVAPNMIMAADDRQFRWFSQSRGVFYFAPPARTLVPVDDKLPSPLPSLLEACIRKMCITKDLEGEEESLIGDDDGLQHDLFRPSSPTHDSHTPRHQAPDPAALLPVQLQKILADPGAYFYRCDLCISRLALKPGALPQTRPHPRHAFQFRAIDQHAGLVPLNQSQPADPHPNTPNQKIELDHNNLIPIRWNICSLNCCHEHLINI